MKYFLPETRNIQNGKLDAQRIAQTLGLTTGELAQLLRRDANELSRHPSSDGLQELLQGLTELAVQLRDGVGSLEVRWLWLRAPNPVLGGQAPVQYLLKGDVQAVQKLLRMTANGMPTHRRAGPAETTTSMWEADHFGGSGTTASS